MQDRYGYDDVDLSDMPYADDDGTVHHPGMGDDPRAAERAVGRLSVRVRAERELDAPPAMAWSAIDDRTYDGDPSNPIGRGPTEADAIRDLLDKIEDREDKAGGDEGYDAIVGQLDLGDEDLESDPAPHPHTWVLSAEDASEVCTECGASRPLGPGTE